MYIHIKNTTDFVVVVVVVIVCGFSVRCLSTRPLLLTTSVRVRSLL